MPKVSDEHRAARRDQILAAALRCAAQEGFHKTTMAAVIRESRMSAGAVYLYFRGKQDIIRALAQTAIGAIASTVTDLAEAEETVSPERALEAAVRRVLEVSDDMGVELPRLALQAWAEAARDAEIRELVHDEAQRIRDAWIAYARRAIAAGHVVEDADPERVGESLMTMVPGFMLSRVVFDDIGPERYAAGLAELRRG
jgi:AcrR family transcriptional regulator